MSNRTNGLFEFGSFRLDAAKRLLTRAGESVTLAPKTFDLLLRLAESQGRALTKAELMQALWPDTFVEKANLSFQMSALRKALGEEGTEWVETVPKHGYRFTAAVTKVDGVPPSDALEDPSRQWTLRRLAPWLVAAVTTLAALTVSVVHFRQAPTRERTVRFIVSPPEKVEWVTSAGFAISPDGERLAFIGRALDGSTRLWIRRLDSLAAEALTSTEGAGSPFWVPDSGSIAFFADEKLKKIDLGGGPPQTLCDAPGSEPSGAWRRDGVILFSSRSLRTLYRVAATGGKASPQTTLNMSRREISHLWPQFLPDGRHFLYFAQSERPENGGIYVGSLDSKEASRLIVTHASAAYAESPGQAGYLLFMQGTTLMAQPFDAERLKWKGGSFPVGGPLGMATGQGVRAPFSASNNGVLAYRMEPAAGIRELVWFDRQGRRLGTVGEPAAYNNPALSPDEKRLAVALWNDQTKNMDLWLFDLARRTSGRFTFDPAVDTNPVWSPDGSRIAFNAAPKGVWDIYQKAATGAGEAEPLLESGERKFPWDWSPDGRFILFGVADGIWVLPLDGDHKPRGPVAQGGQATLSPNGRWIAYNSDESGRTEVYVQSFPPSGVRWQISTVGGTEPQWRRDGKELFFYAAGNRLMAVEVKTDAPAFEAATPKPLFDVPLQPLPVNSRYQVASNGQRFLVNVPAETRSAPITVVFNWPAGVKR